MKKTVFFPMVVGLFCVIGFTWTAQGRATSKTAPTPIQKAMLARAGWLKAMTADLETMRYKMVRRDARALASQTRTIAKKLANPEAKRLTLKVSSLAGALADAAGKKNGAVARMKLAGIKATCGECHAKFRDKK